MKVYFVGHPMKLPKNATFLPIEDFKKMFEKQINLPPRPIQLYKTYHEARQAALIANDQTRPIFTVKYKLEAEQTKDTLPATFSVMPEKIEFLRASFAHVAGGEIYDLKEDEDIDELLNALFATKEKDSQENESPSTDSETTLEPQRAAKTPARVTAMQIMIAAAVGTSFWYFGSQSVSDALFAPEYLSQAAYLKHLGLSLVAGASTFLAQKLDPIKQLQKEMFKKAIPLSISCYDWIFKKEPKQPAEFTSPESEMEFRGQMRSFKEGNHAMYKTFVSVLVDQFYGDPIDFGVPDEKATVTPQGQNTLLFQAPQAQQPREQQIADQQPTRAYNLRRPKQVNYRGM